MIYIDLYIVLRYKKRIFTFLFEWKVIAQKQLKPYSTAYYSSLRRDWFCVLDKVNLSGFPFMRHLVDLLTICTFIAIVFNILDICDIKLFGMIRPTSVYLAKNGQVSGIAYTTIIFYM